MAKALFSGILIAACIGIVCPGFSYAQESFSVLYMDGQQAGKPSTHYEDGKMYVSAYQTARAIGGKIDYMPASGRLVISANGAKLSISMKTGNVFINGTKKAYENPLIIWEGNPYVYYGCLESDDFSKAYGRKISFSNTSGKTMSNKEPSQSAKQSAAADNSAARAACPVPVVAETSASAVIFGMRCANHPDKTRLVLDVTLPLNWIEQKNGKKLNVSIPGAFPQNIDSSGIKGNEISSVVVSTDSYGTSLLIDMADTSGETYIFSIKNPNRIVIDVYNNDSHPEIPDISANSAGSVPNENAKNNQEMPDNVQSGISIALNVPAPSQNSAPNVKNDWQEKTETGKKIVPTSSTIDEIFEEPEIFEEDIENIVFNDYIATDAGKTSDLPSDSIKKNVPAAERKITSLKTKGKNGASLKKVQQSEKKDFEMSSAVMEGLKASGLYYAYAKEDEGRKNGMIRESVSSAVREQGRKTVQIQQGKKIVLIDPSHGGKDFGGEKKFGLSEKQYALLLAREIQDMFEGNEHIQAVLTRDDDKFVPIKERILMARQFKADIMISIHANSSSSSSMSGFEVYSLSEIAGDSQSKALADRENASTQLEDENERPTAADIASSGGSAENTEEGRRLAGIIASEMARGTTLRNNGTKQAGLLLLRLSDIPSAMVFAGYMTNTQDKKIMDDMHSRRRIAKSIYNGILSYAEMRGWTNR